jgi:hypothetical protein
VVPEQRGNGRRVTRGHPDDGAVVLVVRPGDPGDVRAPVAEQSVDGLVQIAGTGDLDGQPVLAQRAPAGGQLFGVDHSPGGDADRPCVAQRHPEQLSAVVRSGHFRRWQQPVDVTESSRVCRGDVTQIDACHRPYTSPSTLPGKSVSPGGAVCARKRTLGRDARSGYSTTAIARQPCHAGNPGGGPP